MQEHVGNADASTGERFTLQVSDFAVRPGELVCVIGAVGSGKSSLMSAILGEMEPADYIEPSYYVETNRVVKRPARPSLVAQRAWIQNLSIKDSILFGRPMDTRRYKKVFVA